MARILILDFGSQYTQLIARRIREMHVYSEVKPYNCSPEEIKKFAPSGIILSGSPSSVTIGEAPKLQPLLLTAGVPVLGICYGMQVVAALCGGKVESSRQREFGRATLKIDKESLLFSGIGEEEILVWMSHGDRVLSLPPTFRTSASSDNSPYAAMESTTKGLYGVQFHPEVTHTPLGREILANFVFKICFCKPTWTMSSFVDHAVSKIKEKVGNNHVICALSGGVDSSVAATLVYKAIGNQLTCLFVDNGLLRAGEVSKVRSLFEGRFHFPLVVVDARDRFLGRLAGVTDPEEKRKRIGAEFIKVFEEEARQLKGTQFLVQGTLYPDVIESISVKGPSAVIKSHHNVGGLPEKMNLELLEPLRELFKDEVREVGREMGLPEELITRHPFPGPGLAVRILGEVNEKALRALREADTIFLEEITDAGWYNRMWQAFCVLLPVKTVGVMGDERTYENVVAIRSVDSQDGMTADWVQLPYDLLGRISNRIINEVKGINRVVYDISSKPPATIEWE